MTIPLNRIVAFAGPYMSAIAGGIASWLVARVNVAGLPGLDQNNLKTGIAGALTWLLVAGLTWAGHSKWLTGHQIQMDADARVNAAAITVAAATPPASVAPDTAGSTGNGHYPGAIGSAGVVDPDADAVPNDGLPSDDEELSSPPPPAAFEVVEPEAVS
jgi:hypothetical protein